jgi:hypothetical protein
MASTSSVMNDVDSAFHSTTHTLAAIAQSMNRLPPTNPRGQRRHRRGTPTAAARGRAGPFPARSAACSRNLGTVSQPLELLTQITVGAHGLSSRFQPLIAMTSESGRRGGDRLVGLTSLLAQPLPDEGAGW